MRGREFLELAHEWLAGAEERHWRGVVGRAYYALMLECRDALVRWGFSCPPRDNVHTFVRMRFSFPALVELKQIGNFLDSLGRLRNKADYDLTSVVAFQDSSKARQAVHDVAACLVLLDAIDNDAVRRAAAIKAIAAAFP